MSSDRRSLMGRGGSVTLLLQRAEAAASHCNQDEARRLFKAVLRHDPTNERALLRLVYLAEDDQATLTYLARLLDGHPHHPLARTAIRWARRRIPTSAQITLSRPERAQPTVARHPLRLILVLILLTLSIGLGILSRGDRSTDAVVQADAPPTTLYSAMPSPSPRPLAEIVKVSIPLFTPSIAPTASSPPAATATLTTPPKSAWVPVLGQPQSRNMSCESRSAADLAGYWDVPVDELEFLTSLGQSDNPHKGFVGNVDAAPGSLPPYGYGVYAEPVAATLREYGLDAYPVYSLGLGGLRAELLAGRPVMVWATYGMEPHEPREWESSDGRISKVLPFMHTFLVTGYDESGLFILDAYNASVQHYPTDTFLQVWNRLDQMSVIITGLLSPQDTTNRD